jgi:hypothetical protein
MAYMIPQIPPKAAMATPASRQISAGARMGWLIRTPAEDVPLPGHQPYGADKDRNQSHYE